MPYNRLDPPLWISKEKGRFIQQLFLLLGYYLVNFVEISSLF